VILLSGRASPHRSNILISIWGELSMWLFGRNCSSHCSNGKLNMFAEESYVQFSGNQGDMMLFVPHLIILRWTQSYNQNSLHRSTYLKKQLSYSSLSYKFYSKWFCISLHFWEELGLSSQGYLAARFVSLVPYFNHITPALMDLHWRPVRYRIEQGNWYGPTMAAGFGLSHPLFWRTHFVS
jgi:hypothetical protein